MPELQLYAVMSLSNIKDTEAPPAPPHRSLDMTPGALHYKNTRDSVI